ncbi:hypothetical protein PROFUN_00432 [Planoprotostelium fungivorum]|uniref:Uncharacterized protein n=1 Tax=Planoprotostelium fungivorum TaxID=1890364 RepID=A0A2P6N0U7_9EUKA|nr:hypothetical protein PROFUN_00432 [Planoprotostelium fungivorum]
MKKSDKFWARAQKTCPVEGAQTFEHTTPGMDPFLEGVYIPPLHHITLEIVRDDTKAEARYCDKEGGGNDVRFRYVSKRIVIYVNGVLTGHCYLVVELYRADTMERLPNELQRTVVFRTPREKYDKDALLQYNASTPYNPLAHHPTPGTNSFTFGFGMLSPAIFFGMREEPDLPLFLRCTLVTDGEQCTVDSNAFTISRENRRRTRR